MATIKSYSDLQQSKKLAKILPLESADMFYHYNVGINSYYEDFPRVIQVNNHFAFFHHDVPCWSLAALLSVLPTKLQTVLAINDFQGDRKEKYVIGSVEHDKYDCYADNPVDACYEMILKLNELKML